MFQLAQQGSDLDGENPGEEISPNGQDDQPGTDRHHHEPTPALHLLRARFQGLNGPLLGRAHQQGQAEDEEYHG